MHFCNSIWISRSCTLHIDAFWQILYGLVSYTVKLKNVKYLLVAPAVSNASYLHCWKKKRDFLIIRSKVGGFLSLTVDGNEYFVGWKENLVHKYHQKWLPIICESRLMFHHIDPIIRSKVGGFLILSVANCEYFVC